ncbi:MAG: electron transfer flavoprotein subunit alpha/FixB family protein, partial [Candidatus Micrarchaeota archaeon]
MKILAFIEQRNNVIKKSSFETVRAARGIADALGGECIALLVGSGVEGIGGTLGGYGASRVLVVDDPALAAHSGTAYAEAIASVAVAEGAELVLLPASQMGKDLAPRVAVKLKAGLASDCIALRVEGGDVIGTRPVYAGKALLDVRVNSPVKVFTLRPNVFPATVAEAQVPVQKTTVAFVPEDFGSVVSKVEVAAGRPDVTEADIVVSGGRGMKAAEHFSLIESLAEVLGAGVGASRAVVDAGWRPHDEQVGQTGKTVSPSLYVAC